MSFSKLAAIQTAVIFNFHKSVPCFFKAFSRDFLLFLTIRYDDTVMAC